MALQRITPEQIVRAVKTLELSTTDLLNIGSAPEPGEAIARLRALLPQLKALYRKRAFDAHPDRGGDTATFQALQEAWDVVQDERTALFIAQQFWEECRRRTQRSVQPQPQVRVHVVVVSGFSSGAGTGTTNSTTAFGGFSTDVPPFVRRY